MEITADTLGGNMTTTTTTTYVVWFGSVAPSNVQAWYVLDAAREEAWGCLAAPVAGPFQHKGMALAEANLRASAAPGNRVES